MRNLDLGDGAVPVEMPISLTQRMVTDPAVVTDATVISDGPYDLGVLEAAAHAVCRRHGATRTTVDLDEGRQTVHEFRAGAVGFHVHRAGTDGLMPTVDRLARRPLDPAALPVFRLLAVVESARRMALHLSLPHAVADISAIEIVMRELVTSYAALLKGEAPALPATRQYADHLRHRDLVCADPATWRAEGIGSRAAAFWSGKLSGSRPPPFGRPPRGRPEGDRAPSAPPARRISGRLVLRAGTANTSRPPYGVGPRPVRTRATGPTAPSPRSRSAHPAFQAGLPDRPAGSSRVPRRHPTAGACPCRTGAAAGRSPGRNPM